MDPDLELIHLIQSGDEPALRELITRHKQAVFHFILRFMGNETDAAELTEETFVKVYFGAPKFKPRAKVKTWIFTIASNLCKDHFRKHKRRQLESLDTVISDDGKSTLYDQLPSDGQSADEEAATNELDGFLYQQIHSLPEKLKIPFIHCVLEERSHDDCAQILGTTSKTVETRIYRARKKLKAAMELRFG